MSELFHLSSGVEPRGERIGGTKRGHSRVRVYAVTCLSVAALIAAAPAAVGGDEFDAPGTPRGRSQPWLSVPPVVDMESPGQANYRVSIGPRESLSSDVSVRIRGLPTAAVLSAGQPSTEEDGERIWVVPLGATEGLKVQMPHDVVAISQLLVTLVDG